MEQATLKKVVMVHGQRVELFSVDGELWSTDLKQRQQRLEQREKEQAKILKGRKSTSRKAGGSGKNGDMKIVLPISKIEFTFGAVQPARYGRWRRYKKGVGWTHKQVEMVRRFSRLSAR
jgi:hypothetical protein